MCICKSVFVNVSLIVTVATDKVLGSDPAGLGSAIVSVSDNGYLDKMAVP